LIRASALLGARCGDELGQTELDALDTFAKLIGLAYQVVDDVLDADAPTATLGKTAGKDADRNKPTYVSALGLAESKSFAQQLREDALKALDPFEDRALRLRQIADFIVLREF
jgi:farnesyl diphosphate synthase